MIYERSDVKAGKIISIWGPVHRDCAISTTTALLSSLIYCKEIKDYEFRKMLVFSNEVSRNREVSAYLISEKIPDGLTNIYNLVATGNFKHIRDINPYVYNMDKGFDILGPSGSSEQVLKQLDQQIDNILDICRKVYDYTIIDVAAGIRNLASAEILRCSDMILICVPQDDAVVKSLRSLMAKGELSVLNERPYLALASKYFEDFNHYDRKIMERTLGFPLLTVSFNPWIHKITHQREVMQNFKREFNKYEKGNADESVYEFDDIYEEIKLAIKEMADAEEEEKLKKADKKAKEKVKKRAYVNPNKDPINPGDGGGEFSSTSGLDVEGYSDLGKTRIMDKVAGVSTCDDTSGGVDGRDDSWLLESDNEAANNSSVLADTIQFDLVGSEERANNGTIKQPAQSTMSVPDQEHKLVEGVRDNTQIEDELGHNDAKNYHPEEKSTDESVQYETEPNESHGTDSDDEWLEEEELFQSGSVGIGEKNNVDDFSDCDSGLVEETL